MNFTDETANKLYAVLKHNCFIEARGKALTMERDELKAMLDIDPAARIAKYTSVGGRGGEVSSEVERIVLRRERQAVELLEIEERLQNIARWQEQQRQALDALPEDDRSLFISRFYKRRSILQIAMDAGYSRSSVCKRLKEIVKNIAFMLSGYTLESIYKELPKE